MDYIIGVDGGGTKTEASAYGMDGERLVSEVSGPGNVLLGFDDAFNNVTSSIDGCMKKLNGRCIYMALGLAGIEAGNSTETVKKKLSERYNMDVEVINDADMAHASLLHGKDGILTISGTGSISFGVYKGRKERAGGWGHILGDEGSGYDISIRAFKKITEDADLGKDETELTKAILKRIGGKEPNDIKTFVYSSSKGEIASIVPVIVSLAKKGCPDAISILKEAGRELADMTVRVYKKLYDVSDIDVGIKGSILTKIDIVKDEFEKDLRKEIEGVSIIDDDVSPSKGAYYLAQKAMHLS